MKTKRLYGKVKEKKVLANEISEGMKVLWVVEPQGICYTHHIGRVHTIEDDSVYIKEFGHHIKKSELKKLVIQYDVIEEGEKVKKEIPLKTSQWGDAVVEEKINKEVIFDIVPGMIHHPNGETVGRGERKLKFTQLAELTYKETYTREEHLDTVHKAYMLGVSVGANKDKDSSEEWRKFCNGTVYKQ